VVIAEKMKESLILLRDLLSWEMADITFLNQNVRKSEAKSCMTTETRKILKNWLWADYLLYDHFLAKFQKAKENFGVEKMSKSLKELEELNRGVKDNCVQAQAANNELSGDYRMYGDTVLGYIIKSSNEEFCKYYAMGEPHFVSEIYQRQKVRLGLV